MGLVHSGASTGEVAGRRDDNDDGGEAPDSVDGGRNGGKVIHSSSGSRMASRMCALAW